MYSGEICRKAIENSLHRPFSDVPRHAKFHVVRRRRFLGAQLLFEGFALFQSVAHAHLDAHLDAAAKVRSPEMSCHTDKYNST